MPTKQHKEASLEALKGSFAKASVALVADYRGLTVAEITDLRRRIQKVGGDFTVAKNTLVRLATQDDSWKAIEPLLAGPTALAIGYDDPVALAKTLTDFAKEKRKVQIEVRGGVLQGNALDAKAVKALADLPSREQLLAKLMGSINSPATGVVMATAGVARKLVYALEARRKQLAG
ncbi:MAG: 50S ribosomal protein L10 [Candidatus Sericytochromatia bacterium]|nr:50S ribosomal protein L10 [Candidatus Sericytochromatia bacterium]